MFQNNNFHRTFKYRHYVRNVFLKKKKFFHIFFVYLFILHVFFWSRFNALVLLYIVFKTRLHDNRKKLISIFFLIYFFISILRGGKNKLCFYWCKKYTSTGLRFAKDFFLLKFWIAFLCKPMLIHLVAD